MSATDEELHNADDLGIDHVSYALFDFSLSFLIYLVITFLVHLYQSTGKNASTVVLPDDAQEAGYSKLDQRTSHEGEGPESYELTEQDLSGEEDAVKIGGEDEVDWIGRQNGKAMPLANGARI